MFPRTCVCLQGIKKKKKRSIGSRTPYWERMQVQGFDFGACLTASPSDNITGLLDAYVSSGLQSTNVARARTALHEALRKKRESGRPVVLSYTSNLISCGLREILAQLARDCLVDAFVTTAGGVEEDIIKCLGSTFLGDFALKGKELRLNGINRVGNLLVPNDNYCMFENFFTPVLSELLSKQQDTRWTQFTTPSEIIAYTSRAMEQLPTRETSLVYWCGQNNIPLFCPALTDGSIGDMIYFFNFRQKGFVVNPLPDVKRLQSICSLSGCSELTAVVLGGGLPKHHLLRNMNIRRPPSRRHHVILVSTGIEADGCVSSSSLTDDVTEGLLGEEDIVTRVQGDAALLFPLLLAGH